jgi:hypothetical protein
MLPLSLRRQSRRALYVGLLVVMVAGWPRPWFRLARRSPGPAVPTLL